MALGKRNTGRKWWGPNLIRAIVLLSLLVFFALVVTRFRHSLSFADRRPVAFVATVSRQRLVAMIDSGQQPELPPVDACSPSEVDHMPCEDPRRNSHLSREMNFYRERHCPVPEEAPVCLVPPPAGYQISVPWPESLHKVRFRRKSLSLRSISCLDALIGLHPVAKDGLGPTKPSFFHVKPFVCCLFITVVLHVAEAIPISRWDTCQATLFALVTLSIDQCGRSGVFRSTGRLMANLPMSELDGSVLPVGEIWHDNMPHNKIADRKGHQGWMRKEGPYFIFPGGGTMFPDGAVQYIQKLSQYIPIGGGVLRTALDMGCGVQEPGFAGGTYFIEVDRLLRPGGYLVISGPPVQWHKQEKEWADLQAAAQALCYEMITVDGNTAVWKKPSGYSCLPNHNEAGFHVCTEDDDPSDAWYFKLKNCVSKLPTLEKRNAVGFIPNWPDRLINPPARVTTIQNGTAAFERDTQLWAKRVAYYKKSLGIKLGTSAIRNIMDMNAYFGSFAASLVSDPVWVMNVVPSHKQSTLGVIYDRGLIGVYHDWCEAFSTYPRTYDLIHVVRIGSLIQDSDSSTSRCHLLYLMLEIDRMLRPEGTVLVRDSPEIIEKVSLIASAIQWRTTVHSAESESDDSEKILVATKKLWKLSSASEF
ncbi:hypothetical protein ACLOJK_006178 [Asimina triloba]